MTGVFFRLHDKPFAHYSVSFEHVQSAVVMDRCIALSVDGDVQVTKIGLTEKICDFRVGECIVFLQKIFKIYQII